MNQFSAALEHSKKFGLEKVELQVYTSNLPAIALYKKQGFEQEGIIKNFRKLDGQYFDCLAMGKFL
jgi:putative acetyltransferase